MNVEVQMKFGDNFVTHSSFLSLQKKNWSSLQGVKTPSAVRITLRCSNSIDSVFPPQLEHRTPLVEVASWNVSVC